MKETKHRLPKNSSARPHAQRAVRADLDPQRPAQGSRAMVARVDWMLIMIAPLSTRTPMVLQREFLFKSVALR